MDIRDLKYKGTSEFSGEFFVEDAQSKADNHTTRRLIFQNTQPIIQTEILLKPGLNLMHLPLVSPSFSGHL